MAYAHQGLDPKPLPYQQFDDKLDGTPEARAKGQQGQETVPSLRDPGALLLQSDRAPREAAGIEIFHRADRLVA